MKRMTQVATFVCIILFLASCSKEDHLSTTDLQIEESGLMTDNVTLKNGGLDDPIITIAASYFPMEIGNEWVYLQRQFSHGSQQFLHERTIVHTIIGTEMIDGNDYYKFERTENGNVSYFYRRFAENGNLVDEVCNIYYSENFNDIIHTEYHIPGIADHISPTQYRMVGSTTPLVVPAGTFNLSRSYRGESNYLNQNTYNHDMAVISRDYVQGIGQVKFSGMSVLGTTTLSEELVSYTLN